MARVSTYLNFPRNTREAFEFYAEVFGTQIDGDIALLGDTPVPEGVPPIPEDDRGLVVHVQLPILGGHVLMGTDAPDSMGFTLTQGNNWNLNLEPDTREETDRLFLALADGGTIETELQEMFWGGYYGALTDRFGTRWMFNCEAK